MELRLILEKNESLETQARDMIRDKLATVVSNMQMQASGDFDALPSIVEP